MERRTVLAGMTAATLSTLSTAALEQFALGQTTNAVPVAADFETSEIKTNDACPTQSISSVFWKTSPRQ
jgi:hypothetical protein